MYTSNMNFITTTGLRTQTSKLIETLKKGGDISLIHRSKVVGVIKPSEKISKPFNAALFKKHVKDLNLPKTTPSQRARIYMNHLQKKYGKGIS